jgi:diguanylate cyclase (GGDEF)-like protein/putative nucleotidyltransferase with HDIG domain
MTPDTISPNVTELGGGAPIATATAGQAMHNASVAEVPLQLLSYEDRLIQARLGFGSSLFTALRCKHAPTAQHCLRVAIGCSSWATAVGLDSAIVDELEVAALLHDIGKVGVPDHLLRRQGPLTPEEVAIVKTHYAMGLEILNSFGAPPAVQKVIRCAAAWYCPKTKTEQPCGEQLPLAARMLAIVDAFDSMTSGLKSVALSRREAMEELRKCGGSQFDPNLTAQFCEVTDDSHGDQHHEALAMVAERWLSHVSVEFAGSNFAWDAPSGNQTPLAPLFLEKMLHNMRDGVIFVDKHLRIKLWNRGTERLTGIESARVEEQVWSPATVGLRDDNGHLLDESECPVRQVVTSSVQAMLRLQLAGRDGQPVAVDMHIVPVIGPDNGIHGANVLMHDVSCEANLEERVQSLHERATRDPLTNVANRAEFDRTHQGFIDRHLDRDVPCSLIITDIDHFKRVNDTYGHQAGDAALIAFAGLLARKCRTKDLVARYGGEEFVILCADCDLDAAARRANDILSELRQMPLPSLNSRSITASFGVTETLRADSAEAMLRRADLALLTAKENGRNCVVHLAKSADRAENRSRKPWFSWLRSSTNRSVMEQTMIAPVPMVVAAEQLRGYVIDNKADVKCVDERTVVLVVRSNRSKHMRRMSDRAITFLIELQFAEEEVLDAHDGDTQRQGQSLTRIKVVVRPKRDRDRKRRNVRERARLLILGLQSYLMAKDAGSDKPDADTRLRDTTLRGTWLEP